MNLTPREQQVAELAAKGLTNKIIGQRLYIGDRTVSTHLRSIFKKLNLQNKHQLAVLIMNGGMKSQPTTNSKALTSLQVKLVSLIVSSPGVSSHELALLTNINHLKIYRELSKLLERKIVFEHHITKSKIQWFPTIVGLAIYKANKRFKEGILKIYCSHHEEKIETQK